ERGNTAERERRDADSRDREADRALRRAASRIALGRRLARRIDARRPALDGRRRRRKRRRGGRRRLVGLERWDDGGGRELLDRDLDTMRLVPWRRRLDDVSSGIDRHRGAEARRVERVAVALHDEPRDPRVVWNADDELRQLRLERVGAGLRDL